MNLLQSEILTNGQIDGLNDRPTDQRIVTEGKADTQIGRPISLNGTNGFEKSLE